MSVGDAMGRASTMATEHQVRNTPLHLYVVGTVAFLWYAMGAATIWIAGFGMFEEMDLDAFERFLEGEVGEEGV